MTIEKTSNIHCDDNIVMILYGRGGVGKTTFAATAPKPLLIDFENGSRFLGDRGLDCDVIRMQDWFSHNDLVQLKGFFPKYDTIILDPIGEAMEKLIASKGLDGKKFRQADGSLSMAGWGEAKKQMKQLIKWLRDVGKNVILVAHVAEGKDGENTTYRIQIATKLSDEIPTMVDIISYMGIRKDADGKRQVVLYTPAQGGNYDSKDRTGRIPEIVVVSEKNGWADFKAAMIEKKPEAPKQEVKNVTPADTSPASADDEPVEACVMLEQLLNQYAIELQGKPYKIANDCLKNPESSDADYRAMYDLCMAWLKNNHKI